MADDIPPKKTGLGRRAFLLGAAGGAAVTALGAAGVMTVRSKIRKLRTPAAVDAGNPAEIAASFEESRPSYLGETTAPKDA